MFIENTASKPLISLGIAKHLSKLFFYDLSFTNFTNIIGVVYKYVFFFL